LGCKLGGLLVIGQAGIERRLQQAQLLIAAYPAKLFLGI
jgi:hypothetical protein